MQETAHLHIHTAGRQSDGQQIDRLKGSPIQHLIPLVLSSAIWSHTTYCCIYYILAKADRNHHQQMERKTKNGFS